eukprot:TRINITY_DN3726_c0_g1_i1.p1 TRINITY_DN3726_c0_g1~~TRINITY_DN3726_c0_g1_i1.p1  ORF type:complete len:315 (-),score=47.22 TRINITY_DN3726_c0_g1_i1:80-1024(-)
MEKRRHDNARYYIDPKALQDIYFTDFNDILREKAPILKVKLIISAIGMRLPKQPIMNRLGKITGIAQFGAVHTALQIGLVVIEWDLSGLVYITPSYEYDSFKALAVLDLDTISFDATKTKIPDLCQLIARWNGTKTYDKMANCQTFTERILEVIGLDCHPFNDQSKIKKFINSLDHLDRKEVPFTYQYGKDTVTFHSHTELDEFCRKHEQELADGAHDQDKRLLKAFDRVYWLRYFAATRLFEGDSAFSVKDDLLKKFDCLQVAENADGSTCGCPFNDPSLTSLLGPSRTPPPRKGDNEKYLQDIEDEPIWTEI